MADINVRVGYTIDKAGLKQIQDSLRAISGMSLKNANPELKQAVATAKELEGILSQAFNPALGTVNLTKLNGLLKQNGLNAKVLQSNLAGAGSQGAAAFAKMQSQILKTNVKMKESSALLTEMAHTLRQSFKYSAAYGAVDKVTGVLRNAVSYTKQLDKSLNDIRIVTDKSAESMRDFAKYANQTAKSLGASTTDLSNAALIYYQQGLSDKEAKARAETTIKAANVTGQTGQEVSEQLTAVWNGYKVTAEETELYVDKLAAVAAATAADLEELSTGMSKVASSASMMGVDIDQLSGILSTVTSVTRQAPESVGTAYRTIFTRMSDLRLGKTLEDGTTLGLVSEKLARAGVEVLDLNGNLRSTGDIITEIGEKWNTGVWTQAQKVALAQQIAGKRQYDQLNALLNNWDMYESALKVSQQSAGTLQHQQEIYMESIPAKLNELKATWQGVYDDLIDTDELSVGIDMLIQATNVFDNFIKSTGGGISTFASFGAILAGIFNKQIGNSIIRQIENLKTLRENAARLDLHRQFNLVTPVGGSPMQAAQIAESNSLAESKGFIASLGNKITNEEREELSLLSEETAEMAKQTVLLRERHNIEAENLSENERLKGLGKYFNGVKVDNEGNPQEDTDYLMKTSGSLKKQADVLKDFERKNNGLYGNLENGIDGYLTKVKEVINQTKNAEIGLEEYEKALEELIKAQNRSEKAGESQKEQAEEEVRRTKEKVKATWEEVKAKAKLASEDMKRAANLEDNAAQAGLRQAKLEAQEAQRNYALIEARQKAVIRSMTTTVTSGLAAATSLYMTGASIMRTWGDESLSLGEKISQTFMSLAMQLPIIISSSMQVVDALSTLGNAGEDALLVKVTKELTNAKRELTIAIEEQNLATARANVSTLRANGVATEEIIKAEAEAKAIEENIVALKAESAALDKNSADQVENAASRNSVIGGTKNFAKNIATAISKIPGPAKIAGVAIAAAAMLGVAAYKAYNHELATAKENLKQSSDVVTNLSQAQSDLATAIENLTQKQKVLDEATRGTTEWATALQDVNTQVREMLKTYPQLAKYVSVTTEGALQISTDGINAFRKAQQESLLDAQMAQQKASEQLHNAERRQKTGRIGFNKLSRDSRDADVQQLANAYSRGQISSEDSLEQYLKNHPEIDYTGKFDSLIELLQEEVAFNNSNKALDESYILQKLNQNGIRLDSENSKDVVSAIRSQINSGMDQAKTRVEQQYSTGQSSRTGATSINKKALTEAYATLMSADFVKAGKISINGQEQEVDTETMISALAEHQITEDVLNGGVDRIVGALEDIKIDIDNDSWNPSSSKNSSLVGSLSQGVIEALTNGKVSSGTLTNESQSKVYNEIKDINDLDEIGRILGTDGNLLRQEAEALGLSENEFIEKLKSAFGEGAAAYEDAAKKITQSNGIDDLGRKQDARDGWISKSGAQDIYDKYGAGEKEVFKAREELLKIQGYNLGGKTYSYEELQIYLATLEKGTKEYKEAKHALKDMEEQTESLVATNVRFSAGMKKLSNIFEKYTNTQLKNNTKELPKVKEALAEILDLDNTDFLSDDFITNSKNLDLLREAANGSEEAIKKLRAETAKEVVLSITGEENYPKGFLTNVQDALEQIDGMDAGATITIDANTEDALGKLANVLEQAGITGEQASAILSAALGGHVEAKQDGYQDLKMKVGGFTMQTVDYGAMGGPELKTVSMPSKEITIGKAPKYTYEFTKSDSSTRNYSSPSSTPSKPGGTGSPKGSKSSKGGKGEKKNDKNPYYRVDSQLAKVNTELEKLNDQEDKAFGKDRITNLKKQSEEFKKQADLYKDRVAITKNELAKLRKENKYGFTFDENGISNYNAALSKIKGAKKYNEALEYAEKYQETIQTLYDDQQNLNEAINSYYEANLKQVEYKIEFSGDFSEIRKEWNNFKKDVLKEGLIIGGLDFSESLGDALFAKENAEIIEQDIRNRANALQDLGQRIAYAATQGADYRDPIYGDLNSMIELYKEKGLELKDLYGDLSGVMDSLSDSAVDTFNALVDNHKKYLDYLDKERSALETLAGVYTSLNGEIDYANQAVIDTAKLQNTKLKLDSATSNRDRYKAEYEAIYAQWKAAADAGSDIEAAGLRKSVDSIESEYAEAMQNVAEITAQMLEDALQLFTDSIKNTFEQTLSDLNGGLNSDQMTQDWEFSLGLFDEDHLDAYHAQRALEDLQKRFEDTIANSSITAQSRLNSLMNEQLDILREREYLTQYDVDRANKLLDIEIKRAALEDAQRNKSKLQLKRDSQGNYSYQFVADQEKLNQATEDLKKAQDELYELELGNVKSTSEQMRDIYKEAMEDMAAHANDSLEEQEKRWEYWQQRITNAANNVKIAVGDLDLDFSDWSYDTLQLTGSSVVEFAKNLSSDVFNGMFEQIQNATAEYQKTKQEIQDTIAANGDIDQAIVNMVEPIRVLADRTKQEEELYNQAYFTAIQIISDELPTIAASLKDLAPSMEEIFSTLSGAYVGKMPSFDTGGYTGSWGSSGKLATLHEKELVLNATDTTNMLKAISLVRPISSLLGSLTNTMGSVIGGVGSSAQSINQNVNIKANFPGVNNSNEIEKAFNNLINMAAQRAYQF